ncbi:beta-N-acetylhexosaminidase [Candidatus Magnetomoraceae bacterium gMMP-1]
MNSFTNEELAGQRLMVGFDGTDLNPELKYLIDTIRVGGIILFSRNIESPEQVKNLCLSARDYAKSSGIPPLFIAIDQEGGQVARLKEPFTTFPGNSYMKSVEDAINFAQITAKELSETGINMNFAPVMDIAPKEINSIMSERAFGHDPDWVCFMGGTVIDNLQKNNILATAKHFPGIGRTTLDSHLDQPCLDTELKDMENFDLIPFKHAIKHKVTGIMLSHILYTKIDPHWPASLSVSIARDMLRREMGFTGLVMTDDLDMGAIEKRFDFKEVIQRILSAEIDLALICHAGPKIETAWKYIKEMIGQSKKIRSESINSVKKILSFKMSKL